MKLFILAAGKGTRLWPLTKNTPKSLLTFNDGTTILERQVENAIRNEFITEVDIVTGYKSEQIEAKIKDYKTRIPIKILFNPVYDITNNLVSVWVAHHQMIDEDFMITNGDNIYKNDVFQKVQSDKKDVIQLTVDHRESYDDDDMKVTFSDGRVVRVSKQIPPEKTDAESVGLVLVKGKKSRRLFVDKVIELVREKEYLEKFWLEIFNSLSDDGVAIDYTTIEVNDWREVDFHPDVDAMKNIILKDF
jgi:choline kinase